MGIWSPSVRGHRGAAFRNNIAGMTTARPANNFLQRLIGAAALDTAIYEEVEADPRATASRQRSS